MLVCGMCGTLKEWHADRYNMSQKCGAVNRVAPASYYVVDGVAVLSCKGNIRSSAERNFFSFLVSPKVFIAT